MSPRSEHGTKTNKRVRSPRVTLKNRASKQQITYNYDAAISQPDVPNSFDYKRTRYGLTVSRIPCKRRNLKARVKGRVISAKNFQKRPQKIRAKSMVEKNANPHSPDSKIANQTVASNGASEEKEISEKENVTDNATIDKNLTIQGKSIGYKEKKKETGKTGKVTQNAAVKVKYESPSDGEHTPMKSPVPPARNSKIPRMKMSVFPVHTAPEFHPEKKAAISDKDCDNLLSPTENRFPDKAETDEGNETNRSSIKSDEDCVKQDTLYSEECQEDSRIVWSEGTASTLDADREEEEEDFELKLVNRSRVVVNNVNDKRVLTIAGSLPLCLEYDRSSTDRQDDESDSKSSPDVEKKNWLEANVLY